MASRYVGMPAYAICLPVSDALHSQTAHVADTDKPDLLMNLLYIDF